MADEGIVAKFQRAGYMWKLPMNKPASEKWQRRMFMAKDGYLLYYDPKKSPTDTHFDNKPRGVIPLGGCTVELIQRGPKESGQHGLKVMHSDFVSGSCLILCAESEDEQSAWMEALQDCGRVTMENARLGDSMIKKLKQEGAETEAERERALARLDEQAKRLEAEQAEKARLAKEAEAADRLRKEQEQAEKARKQLEAELAAQRAAAEKAQAEKAVIAAKAEEAAKAAEEADAAASVSADQRAELQARAAELQAEKARMEAAAKELEARVSTMSDAQGEMEKELEDMRTEAAELSSQAEANSKLQDKLKKEQAKRKKLEKKLRMAEDSLKRLDDALRRSGVKLDIDVFADVRTLRSFFEERVEEVKRDAQKIETMKAALGAKGKYQKESGDGEDEDAAAPSEATAAAAAAGK